MSGSWARVLGQAVSISTSMGGVIRSIDGCCRIILGAIILFSVLLGIGVSRLGYWLSAPATAPSKADLIVALGGDDGERVIMAARLYRAGYAQKILLTGMVGGANATRKHYLSWRVQFLREAGIPDSALLFDGESANSHQEAINTAALLTVKGWKKALIVSDPPHMRRLDSVFRPVFAVAGLGYALIATDSPTWNPGYWWRDEKWAQFSLMEVIKLLHYTIQY